MIVPGLNEHFSLAHNQYSVRQDDIIIPSYFNSFLPDNVDDYHCLLVIAPSMSAGVKRWTLGGKEITIGIYRDEGRQAEMGPFRNEISWTRIGLEITINDPLGHYLHVGDKVNVFNVSTWNNNNQDFLNVSVTEVVSPTIFKFVEDNPILNTDIGYISGTNASYQHNFVTDFYADYHVFRLMPSFKLITFDEVKQIFSEVAPDAQPARRTLYNITMAQNIYLPSEITNSINYELPTKSIPRDVNITLHLRFGQVYDEIGQPLSLTYDSSGYPIPPNDVDSRFKNVQIFNNFPENPLGDSRIYVYDFYGFDLNDPTRGPYYSTTNISKNPMISSNFGNLQNNIENLYSSTLNDMYGNLALGVQANNALVIRKQILPLSLDSFNHPIKEPIVG